MNFANVKGLRIPEGNVNKITDVFGRVLWVVSSTPGEDEPDTPIIPGVPTFTTGWYDNVRAERVHFVESYTPHGYETDVMPVDIDGTGSIMCYHGDRTATVYQSYTYLVGNGTGKMYANENADYMLSSYDGFYGLELLDTSKTTSMVGMFEGAGQTLGSSIDLSYFNTSNVTNMRDMFRSSSLYLSDLSSFNTSKVTDMSGMFSWYNASSSLDLSSFDTSKVTDMSNMFYMEGSLDELDVSNFNTSNVTNMSGMFGWCDVPSLDVSHFNTSKVTDMSNMFYMCDKVSSLDVSNFNTSNVTDMSRMFGCCHGLTTLDVSNFNTSKVTNMSEMFASGVVIDVELGGYDYIREECSSLTELNVSGFDTSEVTNMNRMFYGCAFLTTLDLTSFDTSKVMNMGMLFAYCRNLTTIYVSRDKWVIPEGCNTTNMFYRCGTDHVTYV